MSSRVCSAFAAFLVLWCTCVSVCGFPTPVTDSKSIAEAIRALTVSCNDNPLLTDKQYEEHRSVCSKPLDVKTQLRCLSFLVVNQRLCDLKSTAGFNLTQRINTEQNKPLTVPSLCAAFSNGSFTYGPLPISTDYQAKMKLALTKPERCYKLCSTDTLENDDPDYFCKVLYYGSVIIHNVTSEVNRANEEEEPNHEIKVATSTPAPPTVIPIGQSDKAIDKNGAGDPTIKIIGDAGPQPVSHSEASVITIDKDKGSEQGAVESSVVSGGTAVNLQQSAQNPVLSTQQHNDKDGADDKASVNNHVAPPATVGEKSDVDTTNQRTPTENENQVANPKPKDKEVDPKNPISSVDRPDLGANVEMDDFDSQFAGDKGQLPGDNMDYEDHPEKLPGKVTEKPYNANVRTNDDYLEDDDDHFFPLFFTGVGMMVLLYILYHNKNKVSTMIMGLLIEGRQSGGRRRNSRGHAYRRLDTLEQAISSNAPGATPSKIIY